MRRSASKFTTALLAVLLSGLMSSVLAVADGPAAPPAPTNLLATVAKNNAVLQSGSWTSTGQLKFRFQVQVTTGSLIPEIEVQPLTTSFTGTPNSHGKSLSSSGTAVVTVNGLRNGSYRWQARATDSSGLSSPWAAFSSASSGKQDFGIDRDPPSKPVVSSPTNPNQGRWYNSHSVVLKWASTDSLSGVRGYSYALAKKYHVNTPGSITQQAQVRLTNLSDGSWYLAVRSIDAAGNWSAPATFRVLLDRTAPRLSWLSPSRFTFNPYRGSTTLRFSVSKDARVQLNLYRVGSGRPMRTYSFSHLHAGRVNSIVWTGKDSKGKPVTKGYYFFSATAIDRAHNVMRSNLGGIAVDPERGYKSITGQVLYPNGGKLIIVSLSRETLYAYQGTRLVLQTLVTTGNPNLLTPIGSYSVMAKYHPFEFISPWPLGSPFYYPPSLSQYAMLFRGGGYFLHDAPWRSVFGPGSNGPGQPGSNYGGTHGCVNIPPGSMLSLWNWTPVGTSVDVVP